VTDAERAKEVKRLDTLLASWGVHTGKFRPHRRELATRIERSARSDLVTDQVVQQLVTEAHARGTENQGLYLAELFGDPDWPDVVGNVARRIEVRLAAVPGADDGRFGDQPQELDREWEERQAEAEGITLREFRQRQRDSVAAVRVIADHRTPREVAAEYRVTEAEVVQWIDRALARRHDIKANSYAEHLQHLREQQQRGKARWRKGTPAGAIGAQAVDKAIGWRQRKPTMAEILEDAARREDAADDGGFDVEF
jgi:hypothetical protein